MTLERITSEILETPHGFFTRKGGVSTGIYSGLNCGLGSNDTQASVLENRARVAATLEIDPQNLRSVYQIHSANVVHVTKDNPQSLPKADAMVTTEIGIALGVLTADCTPILFCDQTAGVIGAAHSGWKGAIGGVIGATVTEMKRLGAKRSRIAASVGPTISTAAYEVGPEFRETFITQNPEFAQFFKQGKGDRLLFDLPAFCLHQLRQAGVQTAEWTGECTYSDPSRFYSYRRSCHQDEKDYGRLISAIRL